MGTPFKIIISPSGLVLDTVYGDPLESMAHLGPTRIWRATEVSFDNSKSCWQVQGRPPLFLEKPILATGFSARAEAISWEINYLRRHMPGLRVILNGYDKYSQPKEHHQEK